MLAKRCLYQCVSNMSKNVTCIDKELDFIKYIKSAKRVNSYLLSKKDVHLTQEDAISGTVIKELISMRDGFMKSGWSNTDIIEIIDTLYIS